MIDPAHSGVFFAYLSPKAFYGGAVAQKDTETAKSLPCRAARIKLIF